MSFIDMNFIRFRVDVRFDINYSKIFLIIIFGVVKLCSAYTNLAVDVNYPVIITDKLFDGSNFGSSVALAKGLDEFSTRALGWIFVGAPNSDNIARDGYESGTHPGVVWRCSLGRSKKPDSCFQMKLDTNNTKSNKPGNPQKESKLNSLLGISLTVEKNRLISCAPSWKRGSDYLNGVCYWLGGKNDTIKSSFYYNAEDIGEIVDGSPHNEHRLMPFFVPRDKGDSTDKYMYYNIKQSNKVQPAQDWALGQVGISVHVTSIPNKDKAQENRKRMPELRQVLIGAPGVRLWAGAVVIYTDSDSPSALARLNKNGKPWFSKYIVIHREDVEKTFQVVGNNDANHFDYFGYAVTSGKYDNEHTFYVGGSPRGDSLQGEAIVFKYPTETPFKRIPFKDVKVIETLKADKGKLGSYFGSVLYTMNILESEDDKNSDEIFVGAPLYGAKLGDYGSVFVYQYDQYKETFVQVDILEGNVVPGARFGTAISSITYGRSVKLLVVGAPYENLGNGGSSGAVYIYEASGASTTQNVNHKPLRLKQRINPSLWDHNVVGFGSSLSTGVDIDRNDTPDIAIGSYNSNMAIVLRTRPTAKLKGTISFPKVKNSKLPRNTTDFTITSCLSLGEDIGTLAESFVVSVTITVDDALRRLKLRSADGLQTLPNLPEFKISYETTVQKDRDGSGVACNIFVAEFRQSPEFGNSSLVDVKVVQELKYISKFSTEQKSIILPYDISGDEGDVKTMVSGGVPSTEFKDFAPNIPFTTAFRKEETLSISPEDCKSTICNPNFQIQPQWIVSGKYTNNVTQYTLGSSEEVGLGVVIMNTGETGIRVKLIVDWQPYVDIISSEGNPNCQPASANTSVGEYHCNFNSIAPNNKIKMTLKFDMRFLYAQYKTKEFVVAFSIFQKVNENERHNEYTTTAKLNLVTNSIVTVTGSKEAKEILRSPSLYEDRITFEGDHVKELYSPFPQKYEVHLSGKSPVENFVFNIEIPVKEVKSKHQLIHVPEPRLLSQIYDMKCKAEKYHFFEVKKQSSTRIDNDESTTMASPTPTPSRRKRSLDTETLPTPSKLVTSKVPTKKPKLSASSGVYHIKCDSTEFDCMKITCTATRKQRISKTSPVESSSLMFRLYMVKNVTDDLMSSKEKKELLIESVGNAIILSGIKKDFKDSDVSQTLLNTMKGPIPIWVWVVATLVAIMLLALICFALYKCGFFKREKKEELKEAKLEEKRKSMMFPVNSRVSRIPTYNSTDASADGSREDLLNDDNVDAQVEEEDSPVQIEKLPELEK